MQTLRKTELIEIELIHIGTKETRKAQVLDSTRAWKLYLHLGPLVGCYWLDLKRNRLKPTEHSRRELLWSASNLDEAVEIWKHKQGITVSGRFYPVSTKLA